MHALSRFLKTTLHLLINSLIPSMSSAILPKSLLRLCVLSKYPFKSNSFAFIYH